MAPNYATHHIYVLPLLREFLKVFVNVSLAVARSSKGSLCSRRTYTFIAFGHSGYVLAMRSDVVAVLLVVNTSRLAFMFG